MSERLLDPDISRFPNSLRDADVVELAAGTLIGRIYRRGGAHPATWAHLREYGPTSLRFDPHPDPPGIHPGFGVLYGAAAIPVAVGTTASQNVLAVCAAEVYQGSRFIDRDLDDPHFVVFATTRHLRLLDLGSGWITRAGGNLAISGGLRSQARRWARAILDVYRDDVDGMIYISSPYPAGRALVLWQHARDALPVHPRMNTALANPGMELPLGAVADEIGFGLG